MKCCSIRVTGTVQGVFFRKHTKETADLLGIKGWVRNERDGSVSIHAEGEEGKLADFISWCNRGPERAKVDKVMISDALVCNAKAFDIIH